MKEKERFISIDDSGESIFTFDEADMIIDTKTSIVYGANNVPDLVKILNSQSSQWQKLKEWLVRVNQVYMNDGFFDCAGAIFEVIDKMQDLEKGEKDD